MKSRLQSAVVALAGVALLAGCSSSPSPSPTVSQDALAARAAHTTTTLPNGSALVVGGCIATDSAVIIDADCATMTPVGPMINERFKHTAVLLPSGDVLVIGGTNDDEQLLRTTEIFDSATGTFRESPTMVNGRYKLAGSAAVLPDGRVLVAGGGIGMEIIDVTAMTSTPVALGTAARASFSTVNVVGDRVLILGGYDERIDLTSAFVLADIGELG